MNDSKTFFELMSKILKGEIAGCECGGRECTYAVDRDFCIDIVYSENACGHGTCASYSPCPTCTPNRELLAKLCWHEWDAETKFQFLICKKCGESIRGWHTFENGHEQIIIDSEWIHKANPDLTTAQQSDEPLVVALMKEAGLWEGFILELSYGKRFNKHTEHGKVLHILINGTDRLKAINGYLREVLG